MAFPFLEEVIREKWMCFMLLCSLNLPYEDMKINNQEGGTRTKNNVYPIVCDKSV